jgi:type I restriction enzyme S subunit
MVPLGRVLQLQRRWLKAEPTKAYIEIGIRSFGKGIFQKPPVSGLSLGDKRVLRIEPGDLVFMNVFAWEGAVGVAGPNEAGTIGSHRFATFTPVDATVDVNFLRLYFATPDGRDLLGRVSPGSAGRNRTMNLAAFAQRSVPLPPIGEQRRIVARIDALAAKIAEARGLRAATAAEVQIALDAARRSIFPPANGTAVRDYATVQSGYAFKSEWFTADGIRLVRNVNIGHGRVQWEQVARIPTQRRAEFDRFELYDGDILITLDRPIISTGVKVARVHEADLPSLLLQRVGRLQFKNGHVLPDYLFAWLQSPAFADAIDPGRSNGVPHISPKDVEQIPFTPPSPAEQSKIVAHLDKLQTILETAKRLHRETAAELSALLPSVLSRAFRGEL